MSGLWVDLDLATRSGSGRARLHVGYALHGARVAAMVAHGSDPAQVRILDVDHWQTELETRLRLPIPRAAPPPPARVLDLPWDLLVGTGAALARHRPEVYDALVARDAGAVRVDGRVLDLPGTCDQLRRLHHSVLARLQAIGSGERRGRRCVGWTSWLLFGDGWRELTPYAGRSGPGGHRAMVRIEPRRPADLAALVARWDIEVRA
jgi:hypothetical protein